MKAAIIRAFEPPPNSFEVVDVAPPQRRSGEVLVSVKASSVQPFDLLLGSGAFPVCKPGDIGGLEGVGVIVESEDATHPVGQRILFAGNGFGVHGAWAEVIALDPGTDVVAEVPASVSDLAVLGTVPTSFLTAHRALGLADFGAGKTLLVTNGTGAVGNAVMQLAAALGAAKVIALARTTARATQLQTSGPWSVIDLSRTPITEGVASLTEGAGVDCVVDLVSGDVAGEAIKALAAWGVAVLVGAASGAMEIKLNFLDVGLKSKRIVGYSLYPDMAQHGEAFRKALAYIVGQIAAGRIAPKVAATFRLGEIVQACDAVQNSRSKIGKVSLLL